jgi:hypothetical protein
MDDHEDGKDKAFIRARRNLIGASLVLLCYQFLGISIKELTITGVKLETASPTRVGIALWIIFGYFCLRYYQHFRTSQEMSPINSIMEKYVSKAAFTQYKDKFRDSDVPEHMPRPYQISLGPRPSFFIRQDAQSWKVRLDVILQGDDGKYQSAVSVQQEETVVGYALLKAKIKAYVHMAFHTLYVSEYHLPFMIAATPVSYFIFTSILGPVVQTWDSLCLFLFNQ